MEALGGARASSRLTIRRRNLRAGALLALVAAGLTPVLGSEPPAGAGKDFEFSGHVFRDDNGDGTRDPNTEFGLGDIDVIALSDSGKQVSDTTDASGYWKIKIDTGEGNRWRIEIRYPTSRFRATVLTGTTAAALSFVDIEATPSSSYPAIDVGLIADQFFVDPPATGAPMECLSGLLSSSGDDSIHRYAAPSGTGTPLQPPASQNGSQGFVPTGLGGLDEPWGFTYGPDGDLWVASFRGDEVLRYDGVTGAFDEDVSIGGMDGPRDVTFGLDGRLYINSYDSKRVYWYDPVSGDDGQFAQTSAFSFPGGPPYQPTQGMAFSRNGLFYVSAEAPGGASGRVIEINGSSGTSTGRWWALDAVPRGMAYGPDGLLYVATYGAASGGVWRIDPATNTATKVITRSGSNDVTFGTDGTLFVVDSVDGRVRRYAWPALTALTDYIAPSSAQYTQSTPRALEWRVDAPCANQTFPVEVGDRVWNDADADGVQDAGELGLSNVAVTVRDPGGSIVATAMTDADGLWRWTPDPSTVRLGENYTITYAGAILAAGTPTVANAGGDAWADLRDSDLDNSGRIVFAMGNAAVNHHSFDAGYRLPPGVLGGAVFLDLNNDGRRTGADTIVAGMPLQIWNADASVQWAAPATNLAGKYRVTGLPDGEYVVRVAGAVTGATLHSATGSASTLAGPYEPAPDPDDNIAAVDDGTKRGVDTDTLPVRITAGSEPTSDGDNANGNLTVDLGFVPNNSIGDRVWSDLDRDGVQDSGEPAPLVPVTVELRDTSGLVLQTTATASDGTYSFPVVNPGTYTLRFAIPAGYAATARDAGGDDTLDSDADATGVTASFTITPSGGTGVVDTTRDFGLSGVTVGNLVFDDLDDDGVRDAGEAGLGGIGVSLLDSTGVSELATTTTAGDGTYRFAGLPAGTYRVKIPFLALYSGAAVGYVSSVGSAAESGTRSYEPAPDPDDDVDHDDNGSANWTSGDVTSDPLTVGLGTEPTTEDADSSTNLTTDLGLHKPEGVFVGAGYYGTMLADRPLGYWRLGERNSTIAVDSSGNNKNGTYALSYVQGAPGAVANDPDTAASFAGSGEVNIDGVGVGTVAGAKNTVEFFMLWNGGTNAMPFGFTTYDLWLNGGRFGFNSGCSDNYGMASSSLVGRWVHVVAVFTNGATNQNKLYINGVPQTLSGSISCNGSATTNVGISSWRGSNGYSMQGRIDEVSLYNGELSAAQVSAHYAASALTTGALPTITTVLGTGSNTNSAPGGQAASSSIAAPSAVAVAPDGTVYVNNATYLLRIRTDGVLERVATLNSGTWSGLAIGPDGNIYVTEYSRCYIRKVTPTGAVTNWAGNGSCSTRGDGGPIGSSRVNRPGGIAFDSAGNAYFSEYSGQRVRKVTPSGTVTTLATGLTGGPWGVVVDSAGNVFTGEFNNSRRLLKITPTGTVSTLISDSGAPISLGLRNGKVVYSTYYGCQVKEYDVDAVTLAGLTNTCSSTGDGGAAIDATLHNPSGLAIAPDGSIYVTTLNGHRVRRIR